MIKIITNIFSYTSLIIELTKRHLLSKYKGSIMGFAWCFIHPIIMLSVYAIVFVLIFKSRWGFSGDTSDYVFILFLGLIIYNMTADVLKDSSFLFINYSNYIKKISFPIEILPLTVVLTSIFQSFIALTVWIIAIYLYKGIIINIIDLALLYIMYAPLLLLVAFLFSTIGVFFRDIGHIATLLSQSLLFLTPIFYSIDSAPPLFQNILFYNPLTLPVEQFRMTLFYDVDPSYYTFLGYFINCMITLMLVIYIFNILKKKFADYL
ncbi:ABC transporter permease [Gammaproteobacteria bacterium]|nr:ABC transporter permease [Gammaproteobacteria bacterium]